MKRLTSQRPPVFSRRKKKGSCFRQIDVVIHSQLDGTKLFVNPGFSLSRFCQAVHGYSVCESISLVSILILVWCPRDVCRAWRGWIHVMRRRGGLHKNSASHSNEMLSKGIFHWRFSQFIGKYIGASDTICGHMEWGAVILCARKRSDLFLIHAVSLSRVAATLHSGLLIYNNVAALPREINFKFLQRPHQKYNIPQYGELGFSQFTQMEDDYATNSHYITNTFLFKRLGECTFYFGVKGLKDNGPRPHIIFGIKVYDFLVRYF